MKKLLNIGQENDYLMNKWVLVTFDNCHFHTNISQPSKSFKLQVVAVAGKSFLAEGDLQMTDIHSCIFLSTSPSNYFAYWGPIKLQNQENWNMHWYCSIHQVSLERSVEQMPLSRKCTDAGPLLIPGDFLMLAFGLGPCQLYGARKSKFGQLVWL